MKYKIKDVVNLNHSSIKKDELTNILYLDTANLNQNTINELTEYNFVIDKVPSRARRKVNNNDILLSTVRPNQEHYGILDNPPTNLIVSTGFAVLSPKKDIVNPNYLYAYLTQRRITDYLQIIAENSTSAYPSIKPSVIANLDIELPSMEKQNSIGEFSKSLENKIKLNNQIISTLEELASTLFKRWFVDYEFPDENGNPYKSSGGKMIESELGDIPEVWEVLNLADVSEDIITGKTPSTKEKENYGDEIPFIKIPDMHNNTYVVNTESSLSSLGSSLHPKKLLPKNTICVSCIATPGLVSITSEESHTNQQINAILPKKNDLYFLYLNMKSKSNLIKELGSGGSTTLNLNKTQFGKIKLVYPPEIIKETFNDFCSPLFLKILLLKRSNNQLVNLRDSLLPKLLSGEIEIPQGEDV
ncbi:restriction endonuclease subunit S [Brochothrix thermosphacta]|uniref:restriction endonuclease subunit S n=1 Tax=Brochothrix thermosphacta TaxID=2756 RepID=UPI000490C684|nr:restriction endonuclease subunit S [Brochothrix thermosphacta]ODJ49513.1 hypothetical protein BFR34_05575 [Brochothrix thermosphacta DSM 20171 = FSL F6-1036]